MKISYTIRLFKKDNAAEDVAVIGDIPGHKIARLYRLLVHVFDGSDHGFAVYRQVQTRIDNETLASFLKE